MKPTIFIDLLLQKACLPTFKDKRKKQKHMKVQIIPKTFRQRMRKSKSY